MHTPTTLDEFESAGLNALVRAGEAKEWFAGHFGATLLAGSRLLRRPDLPGPAALALSARLSDFVSAQPGRYAALEASETEAHGLERLLEGLRESAGSLRTSGHPTIYLAGALSVLRHRPERIDRRMVDGLLMLQESGREDDPARYYGVEDYHAVVAGRGADADGVEGDSIDAFRMAIGALDHLVADRRVEGRHYFLTGEKLHLLTHAHAIAGLEELGLADIASRALRAQRDLVRLVEPSRRLEPTPVEPARATPFDAGFWEQEVPDVMHVIKVAEAVVSQVPRLAVAERPIAHERIARIWSLLGIR